MGSLFPKNYEKASLGRKRSLTRKFNIEHEWSGLEVALHAHEIYSYLHELGVKKPNGVVVDLLRYSADALGVPYVLLDEAYFTQTALTEDRLFLYSYSFNSDAKKLPDTELPLVPITIDFYTTMSRLFDTLPSDFWKQFLKKNVEVVSESLDSYDLEALFQQFLKQVWEKVKVELGSTDPKQLEQAREMFLAYFYSNDQKSYRPETMELLLEMIEACLKRQVEMTFVANEEVEGLLQQEDAEGISRYIQSHVDDWLTERNYQRFLRSIAVNKKLTLMNLLLLLYQREEATEVREIHDWIKENRTIEKEANPVFLFGDTTKNIDLATGELLTEKRGLFAIHDTLPLVPYLEKKETHGRKVDEKNNTTPEQIFVILEQIIPKIIQFESVDVAEIDSKKIVLSYGKEKRKAVQQLLEAWIRSEKNENDPLIQFENDSILSVLTMNLNLPQTPIDFHLVEPIYSLKNTKVAIQQLLTNVVIRSDDYLNQIENKITEKEPDKVRVTLDEEIEEARRMQQHALAAIQAEKENKKNKKEEQLPDFSDLLSTIHSTNEGETDDE